MNKTAVPQARKQLGSSGAEVRAPERCMSKSEREREREERRKKLTDNGRVDWRGGEFGEKLVIDTYKVSNWEKG